ncbi:MAG: helix-turn-helix domain-containing protein [Velocimicrobium sp.]
MIDIDYGNVKIYLKDLVEKENISISKLSRLSGIQISQLKRYMEGNIQRVDLSVLSRLCFILECEIGDILKYEK